MHNFVCGETLWEIWTGHSWTVLKARVDEKCICFFSFHLTKWKTIVLPRYDTCSAFETVSTDCSRGKVTGKGSRREFECTRYLRSITFRFSAVFRDVSDGNWKNKWKSIFLSAAYIYAYRLSITYHAIPFSPSTLAISLPQSCNFPIRHLGSRGKSVKDAFTGYFRSYFGPIKIR